MFYVKEFLWLVDEQLKVTTWYTKNFNVKIDHLKIIKCLIKNIH